MEVFSGNISDFQYPLPFNVYESFTILNESKTKPSRSSRAVNITFPYSFSLILNESTFISILLNSVFDSCPESASVFIFSSVIVSLFLLSFSSRIRCILLKFSLYNLSGRDQLISPLTSLESILILEPSIVGT